MGIILIVVGVLSLALLVGMATGAAAAIVTAPNVPPTPRHAALAAREALPDAHHPPRAEQRAHEAQHRNLLLEQHRQDQVRANEDAPAAPYDARHAERDDAGAAQSDGWYDETSLAEQFSWEVSAC